VFLEDTEHTDLGYPSRSAAAQYDGDAGTLEILAGKEWGSGLRGSIEPGTDGDFFPRPGGHGEPLQHRHEKRDSEQVVKPHGHQIVQG
jgi:hypothetical protein